MATPLLAVSPELIAKTKDDQSTLLDLEVDRFSHYMEGITDPVAQGPLNPMERTIVKTYLIFKIKEARNVQTASGVHQV